MESSFCRRTINSCSNDRDSNSEQDIVVRQDRTLVEHSHRGRVGNPPKLPTSGDKLHFPVVTAVDVASHETPVDTEDLDSILHTQPMRMLPSVKAVFLPLPVPAGTKNDNERIPITNESPRKNVVAPSDLEKSADNAFNEQHGSEPSKQGKSMRPDLSSTMKPRLPEIPRLRSRFRKQFMTMGGKWQEQANTMKQFHTSMAERLGLNDPEDWDPTRIYTISAAELELAAARKHERTKMACVRLVQDKWRACRCTRPRLSC